MIVSHKPLLDSVRELIGSNAEAMVMVEPLLLILGSMLKEFARLTKQVLDIVREEEACRRLMSDVRFRVLAKPPRL